MEIDRNTHNKVKPLYSSVCFCDHTLVISYLDMSGRDTLILYLLPLDTYHRAVP